MVDEGTTMADLKGLLDQFAKAMYGADKRTRFRPGYYPFTEPSVAFDVECLVCGGSGCPACSRTRLDDDPRRRAWSTRSCSSTAASIPERYQGFAFGMGVERIANLRNTASATCGCTWRTTCASWSSSDERSRCPGSATTSTSS